MPLIGNTIGALRYVDLPITAGSNPTVTFTTDRVLDLVGIDILAPGASAAALKVGGSSVGAGAISSFTANKGSVWASKPTAGVPAGASGGTGGAVQNNMTSVGNVNWASSGTVQSGPAAVTTLTSALSTSGAITSIAVAALPSALANGSTVTVSASGNTQTFTLSAGASQGATSLTVTSATPNFAYPIGTAVVTSVVQAAVTDRSGAVPAAGALTPLSAAIANSTVVEVDLTGTVTTVANLPAADGNGFITLPTGSVIGNSQALSNVPVDGIPFRVKASDTLLDTFAGIVRLVFQVPFSDPNTSGKSAGTYPNNGVQKGSAGIY